MQVELDELIVRSKYHYSVARRLFDNFSVYQTKKFLSSCLDEMAVSGTYLVNSYLFYENQKNKTKIPANPKKRIETFKKKATRYSTKKDVDNIVLVFELKKAKKESPVEILRKDKILLLVNGEYKALTLERIKELLDSIDEAIKRIEKTTR